MSFDAISNPDIDTTPLEPQVGSFQEVASCDKPNSPETMEDWNKLLEDTRQKVEWLREKVLTEEQKEILRNIYCNLPEQKEYAEWEQLNSHDSLRQAIEKQTVQLFEIAWKEQFVISIDWNNVDFIFDKSWEEYFSFFEVRNWMLSTWYYRMLSKYWYEHSIINWKEVLHNTEDSSRSFEHLSKEHIITMSEIAFSLKELWWKVLDSIDKLRKLEEQYQVDLENLEMLYNYENLDEILERKWFVIEASVEANFWWELIENWDLIIEWKLLPNWSDRHKVLMDAMLYQLRSLWRELITNVYNHDKKLLEE